MATKVATFPKCLGSRRAAVTLELREWETLIGAVDTVSRKARTPLAADRRRILCRLVRQLDPSAAAAMSEPALARPRTRVGNSGETS